MSEASKQPEAINVTKNVKVVPVSLQMVPSTVLQHKCDFAALGHANVALHSTYITIFYQGQVSLQRKNWTGCLSLG